MMLILVFSEIMGKLSGTVTVEGGVTALHKLFLSESKTDKMITLHEAIELYGKDVNNKMKEMNDACCNIH